MRNVVLSALVAVMLSLVAACGDQAPPPKSPDTTTTTVLQTPATVDADAGAAAPPH